MPEQEHETHCPYCGRINSLHAGQDPAEQPGAGDMSICWKCHGVAIYDDGPSGLTVRKPTVEEQAEIDAEPQIKRAIAAMAESYGPSTAIDLWRNQ